MGTMQSNIATSSRAQAAGKHDNYRNSVQKKQSWKIKPMIQNFGGAYEGSRMSPRFEKMHGSWRTISNVQSSKVKADCVSIGNLI